MYESLRRYRLTAKSAGVRARSVTVWASDDGHATMSAVGEVLNRAAKDPAGPWGRGRVELSDPEGVVLHVMPAKDGAE
jgi:hypothetical protein